MINFGLSDELIMIRKTADDFGREKIRTQNRIAEADQSVSLPLMQEYRNLGFDLVDQEEAWEGLGLGLLGRTQVEEALGHADAGISLALGSIGSANQILTELGSGAQQLLWAKMFVAQSATIAIAWSDSKPSVGKFTSLAKEQDNGDWTLNGRKSFVLNGRNADYFIVFTQAETKEGVSSTGAFIVDAKAEGIKRGDPKAALGLEAAPMIEFSMEDVQLSSDRRLENSSDEQAVFRALGRIGLVGAARMCGLASAAFEFARDFAEQRTAFGKPIAHFQGLAFLIADMATTAEIMRCAVARAACSFDSGEDEALSLAAMAVAECHEGAMFITNSAVQVFGGSGFIRDYPVEKWMRDAKAHMAYGIPRQLCDLIVGRLALSDTELSLGEDAPMPELQAVML
jgi:alkylation response protein AidB-like acyl-CoA dehydrogenase